MILLKIPITSSNDQRDKYVIITIAKILIKAKRINYILLSTTNI